MSEKTWTRRRFVALVGGALMAATCAACGKPTADEGATGDMNAQQSACPRGLVRDPYPGRCGLYRDRTDSGYCDLSEV